MDRTLPLFDHAHISRDARGVYTLEIQHAKSLNILSAAVITSLTQAVHWLTQQQDARAVILRGSGDRAFVGGADIYEMAKLQPDSARAFITRLRHLCDAVLRVPVPTIARIPGFCLGGGLELAAACDVRIGCVDAVFGMPEVRVGIPSVIHAALLPGLIGQGAANWLLLTGANVDGVQMQRWGFLQFSSDLSELDAVVENTVSAIVASAPQAVRAQKRLLQDWRRCDLETGLDLSVDAFGAAYVGDEPRQYMQPFVQRKRS